MFNVARNFPTDRINPFCGFYNIIKKFDPDGLMFGIGRNISITSPRTGTSPVPEFCLYGHTADVPVDELTPAGRVVVPGIPGSGSLYASGSPNPYIEETEATTITS